MADDCQEDVFFVERALKQLGVSQFFQSVRDGSEAIAYLRGEGQYEDRLKFPFPTALVLDLKMPGTNGFDVLRWVKEHPECKVIPTIVFSSSSDDDDVHEVYVLGGNAFVMKPSDLQALTKLVQVTYEFWSRCLIAEPPPGGRCE
jgi:CheY-like chemotaxis protein